LLWSLFEILGIFLLGVVVTVIIGAGDHELAARPSTSSNLQNDIAPGDLDDPLDALTGGRFNPHDFQQDYAGFSTPLI